ncbi:MAG: hypothetical protein RR662_03825 [Clostridia bacterium]
MENNIDIKIIEILKELNIPVRKLDYEGCEKMYLVFFDYLRQDEEFSEDEAETEGFYIQLDLYGINVDIRGKAEEIRKIMKKANCYKIDDKELNENEKGIFRRGFRYYIPILKKGE